MSSGNAFPPPPAPARPETSQGAPARLRRACWRRLRLVLWIVLLLLGGFLVHLNRAGLPDFAKERLLQTLRDRGWDTQFSRVRLDWRRGILVEDLHIHFANRLRGPHLFVEQAQCRMNRSAWWKLGWRLDSLQLEGGRLLWPLQQTNLPAESLRLEDLRGDLVFHEDWVWELRNLQASCLEAEFRFSGTLTNVNAIRTWDLPAPKPRPPEEVLLRWQRWMHLASQVRFFGQPIFDCRLQGDALDLKSFGGTVNISAPGMRSPWVSGTNIAIVAQWHAAEANRDPMQAEVTLSVKQARTPWGQAREMRFYAHGLPTFNGWIPTNLNTAVEMRDARTQWGRVSFAVLTANSLPHATESQERRTEITGLMENLHTEWGDCLQMRLDVQATHPLTNMLPARWTGEGQWRQANVRKVRMGQVHWNASGYLPWEHRLHQTNLTWPERLAGLELGLSASGTNLAYRQVASEHVNADLRWDGQGLQINTAGAMAEGRFHVAASLDPASRQVAFAGESTVEPHLFRPVLNEKGQAWLDRYTWIDPPKASAQGRMRLPAWTNDFQQVDWKQDVLPSMVLEGEFATGPAAYRGAEFLSARSPFALSNSVWRLTDLEVTRPEGGIWGRYESQLQERDFHWNVRARVFPQTFAPLLSGTGPKRAFSILRFSEPPEFQGEIEGNWKDLEAVSFMGHVQATNFMVRGEPVEFAEADVAMEDGRLSIYKPKGRRVANETAAASGLMIDLGAKKMYLTNVFARVSARPAARIISDKAYEILAPYEFDAPPVVHAEGVVDIQKGRQEYDLDFDITGGPFQWSKFRFDDVSGQLHWAGKTLLMTNLTGAFHGGRAWGEAFFDFGGPAGAAFQFSTRLTNVNFHDFTEDLTSKTNRLEGIFSGRLEITNAFTTNWNSWQGFGDVYLQDGLIWDIPVFGVFSPILNTIAPGLGNSRARDASATFRITNSIVYTDDLAVNATAMRMQFRGSSDFDRNLQGRMEAELLRNMPAVGLIVSKVLWPVTKLFEYEIRGTLQEPETEPVYIFPKIILLPLNPVKTFREIFLDPPPQTPPAGPDDATPLR